MSSDFIEGIIEKFGEDTLVNINDEIEVISTGCLSLDVSIGIGGIPRGKVTEISGPEGSGKTTIALGIVREALKIGLKSLYIDVENMLDYPLLKDMFGQEFPEDDLVILHPESAEDALEMAEMGFNSGDFALVIVDSIGALSPRIEKDAELSKEYMMVIPRLVAKWLRRNAPDSIAKNNVALVCLNQVRDKIGAYIPTFETPGGHALKHWASVRISLTRGQEIKVGDEKVGVMSKFVIKKNKLSAPFRSYTIPIIFGKGVDSYSDAVDFCSMLGVIKKSGSYYKFEDVTLGQGKLSAGEFLAKNPETLDKIKEMVYNVLNKYTSLDIDAIEEEISDTEEKEN